MVTSVQNSSGSTSTVNSSSSAKTIDPQEFMKIMIKELEQQDPFEPASSKDLVNQVAQIQSIQGNMTLTATLKDLSLSQKLASAGNMIGKLVTGKDNDGNDVTGLVTSVKREGDKVYLELDTGRQLSVENVLTINLLNTQNSTTAGTNQNASAKIIPATETK